jgi:hypothetical protein
MGTKIRKDQVDKVTAYLADLLQDGSEDTVLNVDRVTNRTAKTIGDGYTWDEVQSMGTPEAIIDCILDSKATGIAKYRLRRYEGIEPVSGKVRTQPEVRFETTSDHGGGRTEPDSNGAALRDLALQLRLNSDKTADRLGAMMDKNDLVTAKMLEILQTGHRVERETTDEHTSALLAQAAALATAQTDLQWMKRELERDDGEGWFARMIEKAPSEVVGALLQVGMGAIVGIGVTAKKLVDAFIASKLPPPEARSQLAAPADQLQVEGPSRIPAHHVPAPQPASQPAPAGSPAACDP